MLLFALAGCPASTTDESDDTEPSDTDVVSDSDTDTADTDTDATGDTDTDTDTVTDTDCVSTFAPPAADADADLVIEGSEEFQSTARSLLVVDHDGDGIDDLLIGAPKYDGPGGADAGRMWIAYGPVTSGGPVALVADAGIDPDSLNIQFAEQLADLGDIDGDGLTDVAAFAGNDGEVWIRYGSATRLSGDTPVGTWDAWMLSGPLNQDPIGEGVNGIGDLDGDGYGEVAFANPVFDDDTDEGRLYLVPGRPLRLSGDIDENNLPFVEGAGDDYICTGRCIDGEDFDGDGIVDLAFAADPDPIGTVGTRKIWLRYGDGTIPNGESADDYPRLQDETSWGLFGNTLAFVGDLDGDGYVELAVGDELASETVATGGKVWILRGGSARWAGTGMLDSTVWLTLQGIEVDSFVGTAILGLGDVDCDGSDDLAVGAGFADGNADQGGAVGVWVSPSGGEDWFTDATAQILGGVEVQGFGWSLAAGDVDASGTRDLVVGAPEYSVSVGRAYVFLDTL